MEFPRKLHFNTLLSKKSLENLQIIFEIIKDYKVEDEKGLTLFYRKSEVRLLAYIFEKNIKNCLEQHEINLFYFAGLPGYTWQCGLKNTEIKLQYVKDEDKFITNYGKVFQM